MYRPHTSYSWPSHALLDHAYFGTVFIRPAIAVPCRWYHQAAQTVWMTLPDCVRVAKEVFLDKSTLYFRDLIATVEMQASYPHACMEKK